MSKTNNNNNLWDIVIQTDRQIPARILDQWTTVKIKEIKKETSTWALIENQEKYGT